MCAILYFLMVPDALDTSFSWSRSVAEVAEQSDYGDYRAFTRVFKQSEGIAPSRYRRDFLESDEGEYTMQTKTVQLPSAALAYEKYGDGEVNLVIEMGLGASMAEWRQLATKLAERYTVLLYQRAGYGASSTSI